MTLRKSKISIILETGGNPTSKTSAHHSSVTVATFRSWRGSQSTIAKPPAGLPLQEQSIEIFNQLASTEATFIMALLVFAY